MENFFDAVVASKDMTRQVIPEITTEDLIDRIKIYTQVIWFIISI